jgi:hypothetical protein
MNYLRLEMVTGRSLGGLRSSGFIKWPVDKGFDYVKEDESGKQVLTNVMAAGINETLRLAKHFKSGDQDYVIQYMDGCFYPFVFRAKQI